MPETLIMLLPLKTILRPQLSQMSTICCKRLTFEAKVAMMMRLSRWVAKMRSSVSPTLRSEMVVPGFSTLVLSPSMSLTPLLPISAMRVRSIACPSTGV